MAVGLLRLLIIVLVAVIVDVLQLRETLSSNFCLNVDVGVVVLDDDNAVVRVVVVVGAVSMQTGPAIEAQICPS